MLLVSGTQPLVSGLPSNTGSGWHTQFTLHVSNLYCICRVGQNHAKKHIYGMVLWYIYCKVFYYMVRYGMVYYTYIWYMVYYMHYACRVDQNHK